MLLPLEEFDRIDRAAEVGERIGALKAAGSVVGLEDLEAERRRLIMGPFEGMAKAAGSEQAGHKYIRREPDGKGGWIYHYAGEAPGRRISGAQARALREVET